MTEAERLLRSVGGVRLPSRRHVVYLVQGERFALHRGGKPNPQEIIKVRARLRQLGLLGRKRKGA